ncbi:FkbM family methyltransferase [Bradyrhizobium sp. Ash2021]|uniref:FkbM family methyltransferase n=1 Tax=Bradyrhizobium sp. Ash2021 TaxID=2954771 RepID=UPI0028160780|nr:FkbM family methyltransferase [Bradyrhizobium sp. Ash2021]WMT72558.1 FkbM family methyltransferase [Bradyrhizobium sp. Ash2021]
MKRFVSTVYRGLNRLIEPFGVRLLRTNAPTRSFSLFFKHLKALGFEARTVVDVGVAFGTAAIYDAFPRARYFLVEPVAECRPVLEKLKQRLNAEYFLVAAGAENGEVTFNVHDDISGSSLFPQVEGEALDGEARPTPMRRLDSLLPATLERPVFLKLDTQGAEIEALEGLGDRIAEIDLLIVETTMMPMRHGIPQFADVVRYCDEAGFAVYDVLEGHVRALDGALAQIDLAFVPKESVLRRQTAFFNPDQLADYLKTPSKLRGTGS